MLAFRALSILPFPLLYAVAGLVYFILYYVVRYRRSVVKENLRQAFPDKTEPELKRLEKRFFWRFSQVALEIVKARNMTAEDFHQRVTIKNPELVERCSNGFKDSIVVLSIHQANWEWMLLGATLGLNIPIDPVYKPLHNLTADKLIYDIRSKFGSRPLAMDESMKDILRHRRKFRLFVMLADQSPVRSERSHWTTFMNQEAAFYLGGEAIAKLTKFPVLFVHCRRLKTGYYEIEFKELAAPPYDKKSHHITEEYVRLAEEAIREAPESWLWSNRRWKRKRHADEISD